MTFTIGRAVLNTAPSAMSQNGDSVSLSIDIATATLDEAKVRRGQLLGLMEDTSPVPVTWSDDPDFDGFYQVSSVSVDPEQAYLTNRLLRCRIDMTRVGGGYAAAFVELFAARALRTNTCSVTTAVARPTIVHPFAEWSSIGLKDPINHADGQIIRYSQVFDLADVLPVDVRYRVSPADYLIGAATIERSVGGVWYPQIGAQLPDAPYTSFRLSNAFVRVSLSATGVVVQATNGAASYGTAYTFDITPFLNDSIFGYKDPVTPRVLRNDPAAVTIQWAFANESESYVVEMLLRRGCSFVECQVYNANGSNLTAPEIKPASGTSSATTAGIAVRSAADANTHRWWLASALTSDVTGNTTGRIRTASTKSARFAFGITGDGAGGSPLSTWENYYAAEVYEDVFAT